MVVSFLKRFWWAIVLVLVVLAWVARRVILLKQRNALLADLLATEALHKETLKELEKEANEEIQREVVVLEGIKEEYTKRREDINEKLDGDSARVAEYWNRAFARRKLRGGKSSK